jgi:tetratricopeptide (TPR) repeat protein
MDEDVTGKASQDENIKAQALAHISARRLWLFRVITAVILPILIVVLLEVVLRVVGYGFPTSAFVKCQFKGRTVYCSNPKFGWRFFPPEISRFLPPFVVPADKTDNTYRIFILGESAAWGDPDPSYCFGRQLSVMLRQQFPSVNFEVYTAAMVAINSHSIVRIAEDCARLKPDLFIVYAGNNEVVGPYGAGTVFSSLSKSLLLIRFNIAMKATRVGQLMSRLAYITSRVNTRPEIWGGMEMFLGKQIRHNDEKMQYVYSHFRRNLEDIARFSQKAGAKTIFSTLAVNLKDCPPFASMHKPGLNEQQKQQFGGFYQAGLNLEKARDFSGAIDSYLAAAEIDDTYAELQFRLGRCQWNLEQFDSAKKSYTQAMELDTLRFRADSTINRIVREVGENREPQGVYFVDAADEFARQSPHNCPGFELFFDHVHPIFSGNFLLAKTIFGQVEQVLPDKIKAQKAADAAIPSEEVCARQLAFTVYDNLRITQINLEIISNKQPFTNQAYHEEAVDFWRQKVERLNLSINPAAFDQAMEQYEQAIKLNSTDRYLRLNYFKLLYRDRKYIYAAAEQCRLITEQTPYDFETLAALANLEAQLEKIDSALEHAVLATRYMPTDTLANLAAGALYKEKGQYEKAQRYIAEVVRLNPKFVQGYINLAWLLGKQGKIRQAERVYRKGIEAVPDNASLHLHLSLLLRQKGQLEEAEKERLKAITLDPNVVSSPTSAPGPMK